MHLLYTFLSLVPVRWVPHSSGKKILHLGMATNQVIAHFPPCVLPKAPRLHLVYTFWSLVPVRLVKPNLAMVNITQHIVVIHMVPNLFRWVQQFGRNVAASIDRVK